ncbi:ankyrin repeat-containing domain protein [Baffinella frigidus]|nr:ankyrin repeat-containing domain protein [Cryptophyta sp. CCMP2293]
MPCTILQWNMRHNVTWYEEATEVLLELGADPNVTDADGMSPLMCTVWGYHDIQRSDDSRVRCAKMCIDKGAFVNAQTIYGFAPILVASMWGCVPALELLVGAGADLSVTCEQNGMNALHCAAKEGRMDAARFLVNHGVDMQSECHQGTAEQTAVLSGRFALAEMLRVEALRRAKCEAFAMGHQERLGAGSRVCGLDQGVVRMVLEQL